MVTRPKKEGLGIVKLRTQNDALLLKSLHKMFNRSDIPWVKLIWESHYDNGKLPANKKVDSFWWRNALNLVSQFKGIAQVHVQDGATLLAWKDHWQGHSLQVTFPELFSFVKKQDMILQMLMQADLPSLFCLPLSEIAYQQSTQLQEMLQRLSITTSSDV
jgi:hypothetical protein